jgi:hypothetical protein
MFGSSMLDIAIGIIFVFLLLSVFATTINELIASLLTMRGKRLFSGIQSLLNEEQAFGFGKVHDWIDRKWQGRADPKSPVSQADSLVAAVYNSGHIFGLFHGSFEPEKTRRNLPSYIPAANFALALMEEVKSKVDAWSTLLSVNNKAIADAQKAADAITSSNTGDLAAAKKTLEEAIANGLKSSQTAAAIAIAKQKVGEKKEAIDQQTKATAQVMAAVMTSSSANGVSPTVLPATVVAISDDLRLAAEALAANKDTEKIGKPLVAMIDRAGNDAAKLQQNVEAWFNSGMDRVSGVYKYYTQGVLLLIGFIIAVSLNANTIAIVRQLQNDPTLRQSIVAAAQNATPPKGSSPKELAENTAAANDAQKNAAETKAAADKAATAAKDAEAKVAAAKDDVTKAEAEKVLAAAKNETATAAAKRDAAAKVAAEKAAEANPIQTQISNAKQALASVDSLGIPLGRKNGKIFPDGENGFEVFLGWLITAVAISLGAPFWFDMLNKIMVIRSTVKPTEKSKDEHSKS